MEDEPIFYRGGRGDEIRLDPRTLNLDELPLVLAMAGWTVSVGLPEEEDGEVSLMLLDSGGSQGRTGAEMALALRMIDEESGELLPGYSVNEESGRLHIGYKGVADMRFAEFSRALHELSPFSL